MRGSNAERWKLTSLSSPIFEVKYFPMLFTVVSVFMAVAAADMVESGFDHLRDSVGDKGTFLLDACM